jgi:hypothetical protein
VTAALFPNGDDDTAAMDALAYRLTEQLLKQWVRPQRRQTQLEVNKSVIKATDLDDTAPAADLAATVAKAGHTLHRKPFA